MRFILPPLLFLVSAQASFADAPEAVQSVLEIETDGAWRISVTIAHPDTGWDHFADGWRIEDEAGNIIAERVLAHPHVDEQPFTRSTGGVDWPDDAGLLYVRTKCSRDGWSEERVPFPSGE